MEIFDLLFRETDAGLAGVLSFVVVLGALLIRDLIAALREDRKSDSKSADTQGENTMAFIKLLGTQSAYIDASTRRLDTVTDGIVANRTIIEKNYAMLDAHGAIIRQIPTDLQKIMDGQQVTKNELLTRIDALRDDVNARIDSLRNDVQKMPSEPKKETKKEAGGESEIDTSYSQQMDAKKEGSDLHTRTA